MSSGRYFLLVLLSIAVGSPAVEATCEGVILCLSDFPYQQINLVALDFRTPGLLNEFCQHFYELETCITPEIATCEQQGLQEEWASVANRELYVCSDVGRNLYLANIDCLDSQIILAAVAGCSNTFNNSQQLILQKFQDGQISSAEEAYMRLCGAIDDLFRCLCVEVLPICGQDAATFYHTYTYRAIEVFWRGYQCPVLYGSATSCSSDVTERPISMTSTEPGEEMPTGSCPLVQRCVENSDFDLNDFASASSHADLEDTCRDALNLDTCVKNVLPTCEERDQLTLTWEAQIGPYRYLCNNGRSTYLQHQDCIQAGLVSVSLDVCQSNYHAGLDLVVERDSQGYYQTNDDAFEAACNVLLTNVNCWCQGVAGACGENAANFMHQFNLAGISVWWEAWYCQSLVGDPPSCYDTQPTSSSAGPNNETPQPTSSSAGPNNETPQPTVSSGRTISCAMWLLVLGLLTTWLQ